MVRFQFWIYWEWEVPLYCHGFSSKNETHESLFLFLSAFSCSKFSCNFFSVSNEKKNGCSIFLFYSHTYWYQSQLWYKHIYKCKTQAKTDGLCCSDTKGFINFWFRFFDARRETQFLKVFRNDTILTPPPKVRHISWCLRSQFISVGRDLKNSTEIFESCR